MTPLRAKMIKAMQVRGFSVRTHESYLYAVTDLARYFRRAPDQLGIDDLRRYFEYLATERGLSGASCRQGRLQITGLLVPPRFEGG
ncbi:site-specific integrase [Methylococcus geothermalis]|uniref:Core-binding (CB) domain-containing protein n=1 Tax=Methylococcus geothermalis TaxID=2681310 RepID=A0A858QAH0_9GAMM|nr:site-specific integrase [Methylococcus geothermalis]QJD30932.1 hypothetical protein GNH96_13875 [Methylococcus geothermalis]